MHKRLTFCARGFIIFIIFCFEEIDYDKKNCKRKYVFAFVRERT